MKKVVTYGLFAATGISLGILGTLIGLTLNTASSSSSASSSENQVFNALSVTNVEPQTIEDYYYPDEVEVLIPYYEDYSVMDVATLENNEGYFIIFGEDVVETIQGIEVTFERLHMRHLNLAGHIAWQHYFIPSDDFRLYSSMYGNGQVDVHIETILVETDSIIIPLNIQNVFSFIDNSELIELELEGNYSTLGAESGDEYISAFIEVNLDTHAFTTFGKKSHSFNYIEFEDVHRVAQYRYLAAYDIDREHAIVQDTFLDLDLSTVPNEGQVISQVILAVNENNERVFDETIYSGFFSDGYIDLDFDSFSLLNGDYQQGYNGMIAINLDFEFDQEFDNEDNLLGTNEVLYVGEALFSDDVLDEIDSIKDLVYSDDRVDTTTIEIEIVLSMFDGDIVLEVMMPVIHYETGNELDVSILLALDVENNDIYVILQQQEYNFDGLVESYQLIEVVSEVYRYRLVNGLYVPTLILEASYGMIELLKLNGQFLVVGYTNAFAPIDFDNIFMEGLVVLLYDDTFTLLDGVALYGNKPLYLNFDVTLTDNTLVFDIYTESSEGFEDNGFTDTTNYYLVTILLS